jgi:hypothetical protein
MFHIFETTTFIVRRRRILIRQCLTAVRKMIIKYLNQLNNLESCNCVNPNCSSSTKKNKGKEKKLQLLDVMKSELK